LLGCTIGHATLRVIAERGAAPLLHAAKPSASEWRDPSALGSILCQGQIGIACPTNTATPGSENPTQTLVCGSPCAAFLDRAPDLLE
jgi:hypothetical protein